VDAGARRIFHLTHLRNLPGIVAAGRILADAAGAQPIVDLSSADTRDRRREAMVAGRPVADFVPFFLAPDAPLWLRMRGRVPDSRLADEAQGLPAAEFVLLVSSVREAGEGALLADDKSELLVPGEFPFSGVALVGVANDRVRTEVRALLGPAGFGQKVSVYPPWFERPESNG
jgi:hypothetical protein